MHSSTNKKVSRYTKHDRREKDTYNLNFEDASCTYCNQPEIGKNSREIEGIEISLKSLDNKQTCYLSVHLRKYLKEKFRRIFPKANLMQLEDLCDCIVFFNLLAEERLLTFLALCGAESDGLIWIEDVISGEEYEGRVDLGNRRNGDGRKYKRAGVLSFIGRLNYQGLSNIVQDKCVLSKGCSYVAKFYPFTSAGFLWHSNNINLACDEGATIGEIASMLNQDFTPNANEFMLEKLEKWYAKAKNILSFDDFPND